jgi:CHAT domain-containing protein
MGPEKDVIAAEAALALASQLITEGDAERHVLLAAVTPDLALPLAWALKGICFSAWSSDPPQAVRAATILAELATLAPRDEIRALAAWAGGIAALVEGHMEHALAQLQEAQALFDTLGQPHVAAETQVSQLMALAMLGQYDLAAAVGRQATDTFVTFGDLRAAGKIELNLGNLHFRRDAYTDAEHHYRAARERFAALGDVELLIMSDNGLADVLTWESRFDEAANLYRQSLARAEAAGLRVLQAMLEGNLGWLELSRGDYDHALQHLEQSRRSFAALEMPHRLAVAEQHLADAYLEINLIPEALAINERAAATFAELGMRFDQAWTLAQRGRALSGLGRYVDARQSLQQAQALFEAEENEVCAAMTALWVAELVMAGHDPIGAARIAVGTEAVLAATQSWHWWLMARWLRGESARVAGDTSASVAGFLESTRLEAERYFAPHIARRCFTSLGLLHTSNGDAALARQSFERAAEQLESQRAGLPSEEFRTAFLADKLTPYTELARLCLDDPAGPDAAGALRHVERLRARALLEMMAVGGGAPLRGPPPNPSEAALLARLDALRAELNWSYAQRQRALMEGDTSPAARERLSAYARERETAILDLTRQVEQGRGNVDQLQTYTSDALDLPALQVALGTHTALVEYFSLDGELLALIVTDRSVDVVRPLASEKSVDAAIAGLRFQIETLQHGAQMGTHMGVLTGRIQQHLRRLYDLLLRPLEALIGDRRLALVPHRATHYVPFHALHDGQRHVIEAREVCTAPSAATLLRCLRTRTPGSERPPRAVLIGVPDEHAPRVRDEVQAIASLFEHPVVLLGEQGTLAALHEHAIQADFVHLACHGQFRPDNPLFSSLKLGDGWLTVRDAYALDLHCQLVTLSACETGANAVAPGDELIGLARGFFSAGTPSLLVSLWTVDDDATARLMQRIYQHLLAGAQPAAALRAAQCDLLSTDPHPFLWAPFVLMGHW